ncbi:hypothetical protein [Nocardioides campestrisoli]|uniref:hypothetical protein n=1 Tax=Nocardioides campestrisoli TaxID=2736757 RepID=UPI0015E79D29|nr:hypothetical protein [Nocardioides campestrisoli]
MTGPEDLARGAITAAWVAELERLEADVHRTEELIADPTEALLSWHTRPAWHAPSLGPVPEHLRPRAEALLARQGELRTQLTEALAALARQRGFADRVSDATASGPAGPAYLDITA